MAPHRGLLQTWVSIILSNLCAEFMIICLCYVVQCATQTVEVCLKMTDKADNKCDELIGKFGWNLYERIIISQSY